MYLESRTAEFYAMPNKLKTAFAFTKHLFETGAFAQTSRRVEVEISKYVSSAPKTVVVELGMGHGNISRELLRQISPTSKLYCFEVNEEFCEQVKSELKDERLIIINDDAASLREHIKTPVDSFIGSIPFSFFSREKQDKIVGDAYQLLKSGCYFSQVQYTKRNYRIFQRFFDDCHLKRFINIPLEYIYHCKKV